MTDIRFVSLEKIIIDPEKFDAHLFFDEEKNLQNDMVPDGENKSAGNTDKMIKRESLLEHTLLCQKYFTKLYHEKQIEAVLHRFSNCFFKNFSKTAVNLFKEMFCSVVTFHDTGKINPEFQKIIMKNENILSTKCFQTIGTQHSIISAMIYFDYYEQRIAHLDLEDERKIFRRFLVLHAYVIARHHGKLEKLDEFLLNFQYEEETELYNKCAEVIRILKMNQENYVLEYNLTVRRANIIVKRMKSYLQNLNRKESIYIYAYIRLVYSLLIASDYYATSEFKSGAEIYELGNFENIDEMVREYNQTSVMQSIRKYEQEYFPNTDEKLEKETDINVLRSELFLESEKVLLQTLCNNKKNMESNRKSLYFIEAPTGSGKSNISMNLSFQFLKRDKTLKKLFYVYPFNTLVEQNVNTIEKLFAKKQEIIKNIAVINSTTPIKQDFGEKEEVNSEEYSKALLDRQFLNYPMILTTHVSLFNLMFDNEKESAFSFFQLSNSVIVLDEIQSYRNKLWGEIIYFLQGFASLLNMKIIIMSATLPDLEFLTEEKNKIIRLIQRPDKFYKHPCFKNRVKISYELLELENVFENLYAHVKENIKTGKKILVEFITKRSAIEFYRKLKGDNEIQCPIECMTGDDSIIERKRILSAIEEKMEQGGVLTATQVIEAGVDIDMDIGYKDISKLDSEEQLMGRINRSCLKDGIVYFFNLDNAAGIYRNDVRKEKILTLENREMQRILEEKNFGDYYKIVLDLIRKENGKTGESGLEVFFKEQVSQLNFKEIKERMRLIEEDKCCISVYLAAKLYDGKKIIDGNLLWEKYVNILKNYTMDYSEKRVRLSKIKSEMNYFIYQLKKKPDFVYEERIGELYYISDGERYFEDGKMNREKLEGNLAGFVDFI